MASRRVRRAPPQAPPQASIRVKPEPMPNSYANSVTDFGTNGDDAMDETQFHQSSKAGRGNRSNARESHADAHHDTPFHHLISHHIMLTFSFPSCA